MHGEFLDLPQALRARWPGQKLHLAADNFSPHRHPDVLDRAAATDVELVFLPTHSSRMNRIEAEFTALRYFTPGRHRPPQPHRTERRDRRLHPPAQRPNPPTAGRLGSPSCRTRPRPPRAWCAYARVLTALHRT